MYRVRWRNGMYFNAIAYPKKTMQSTYAIAKVLKKKSSGAYHCKILNMFFFISMH